MIKYYALNKKDEAMTVVDSFSNEDLDKNFQKFYKNPEQVEIAAKTENVEKFC